ncbi:MAG TPA: hypothetical protein VFZ65_11430 [Planctomycetota bacterium]|nr:hypothetical protein [Planctomycetota bacterium]
MASKPDAGYRRSQVDVLASRLAEPRRFIHHQLLVGGDGIAVEQFSLEPIAAWARD